MEIPLSDHEVKDLFKAHGYPLDPDAITVFAIRNEKWVVDKFNDVLGICYPGGKVLAATGTTLPGKHWLTVDDGHPDGVFILRPDFYPDCFIKRKHNGQYDALCQAGPGIFKGFRDKDMDGRFDILPVLWDNVTGLNYHTTRWERNPHRVVGKFGAGCQVVEVAQEYDKQMAVVYASTQTHFSYALFQN